MLLRARPANCTPAQCYLEIVLKAHFDACESQLLATVGISANSGHTQHKGSPRETFVRDFLADHLGNAIGIGNGEVIDAGSRPNESRNQIDVVLFRNEFPRLSFGGGVSAFIAESVLATIEVKSVLTKKDFVSSVRSARRLKGLARNSSSAFSNPRSPPGIMSYLVALDGPKHMQTIYDWIGPAHKVLGIAIPELAPDLDERAKVAGPSLDGVFVLGRGFLYFDNAVVNFVHNERRERFPNCKWAFADTDRGSLLLLFLLLMTYASSSQTSWFDPFPYLMEFQLNPNFEP